MRQLRELVGITYGEFQSWYNYGEIRLGVDRFVHMEVDEDNAPDSASLHAAILFERTPQLGLEDEEGLLLVQIGPSICDESKSVAIGIDAGTIHVPIERIQHVIPLTDRARRILETRLEPLGIRLSAPYFQESALDALFIMSLRNALRGGDALIGVLFEKGADAINNNLRCAVEMAIRKMDHPGSYTFSQTDRSWVQDAYAFARHDSYDKGDVNYFFDAGLVLKSFVGRLNEDNSLLDSYRDIVKDLDERFNPKVPLHDIVADQRLIAAVTGTAGSFMNVIPSNVFSLIMFLRWKERFHKHGEQLDFKGLIDDSSKFAESAGFEPTVIAIWLLGCFAGYERIAVYIYSSNPERYSWYSGDREAVKKVGKPEKAEPVTLPISDETEGEDILVKHSRTKVSDLTRSAKLKQDDAEESETEKNLSVPPVKTEGIPDHKKPRLMPDDAHNNNPVQEDLLLGKSDDTNSVTSPEKKEVGEIVDNTLTDPKVQRKKKAKKTGKTKQKKAKSPSKKKDNLTKT